MTLDDLSGVVAIMALEQVDYIDVRLESADLPAEALQIHKLRGREVISQPFEFELEVVCLDPAGLDAEEVVGAEVTILFERLGEELRRVHGVIWELGEALDPLVEFKTYRMRVVPRAMRLSLVSTQVAFLELSVPQIIEQKLRLVGLSDGDFELRLAETYPTRDLVVQYRETDLAFISRLAEHLGISYSFEHDAGVDKIVFTDQQSSFAGIEPTVLRPRGERLDVYRLDVRTKMIPAVYVVQDYNYRTPQVEMRGSHELPVGAGGVVEYGGHFKTPEEGAKLAQVRAEERQVDRRVYTGESLLPRFAAGSRVAIEGVTPPELLLVEVEHVAERPVLTHGGDGGERHYQNTFRAIPAAHAYRPPRITPRPRIHGLLNAVVEHGIEIGVGRWSQIDEWGRYTVRFLFDTDEHPQKQSRWCRMLQPHAGTSYGMRFPLKPGTEVLLGFVDGDPDRPVIVGATFRPDTPSPVTSANAVINKLKSESGILIELRDA